MEGKSMDIFLLLVVILFLLWLDWYMAQQFYIAACDKGYNERKYFWICFWLVAAGWLLVVALPDKSSHLHNHEPLQTTNLGFSDNELPDL